MRQRIFYIVTNLESEFERLQRILNTDPEIKVACMRYVPGMYVVANTNRIFVMPKGMDNWRGIDKIEFKAFCARRSISIYHLTETKLKWAAQQVEEMKL